MTHRYEILDQVYAEHPEIKALVLAACDTIKAARAKYPLTEESMEPALAALLKAGKAVDNRNWLG